MFPHATIVTISTVCNGHVLSYLLSLKFILVDNEPGELHLRLIPKVLLSTAELDLAAKKSKKRSASDEIICEVSMILRAMHM